jgi:hypothetical protein
VSEHPFEVTVGVDYVRCSSGSGYSKEVVDSQVLKVPGALFDLQILATPL